MVDRIIACRMGTHTKSDVGSASDSVVSNVYSFAYTVVTADVDLDTDDILNASPETRNVDVDVSAAVSVKKES